MGAKRTTKTARAVLFVLLVFNAAACGARVAPDGFTPPGVALAEPTDAATTTATESATTDPSADDAASATPAAPGGGDSGGQPSPTASPDFGPRHNNGVLTITLSATCVTRGTLMVATLKGPPKAGIGAIVGYSDNQPHGAMITGETDDSGTYVWRFPVAPTAPYGQATLLATATGANWDSENGGTADKKFQVVERLEDC